MSTADSKQTTRKQKQKESKSQQHQNATDRLKTVVRRLPPSLPEDIFWQSVQAWVTEDTVTWKLYCPGKIRKSRAWNRVNKEIIPSRAYIAFKNEEMVATFSREYDGHLFRDKAGNESQAIVEFAPFQKIPTEKKKADARNNTIDKDEDYLSFLESLKNSGKPEGVSLEALIAASQPPPPPTTTPLLEALKAEKSAQKDKETILRNHAHYKDPAVSGAASRKEEAKKKTAVPQAQAQAQQPAKQSEPPTPSSKKAKKVAAAAAASASQKAPPAGQDGPGTPAKGQPAGTAGPSTFKPPAPRARPPKEPHGRQHSGKGDASTPASASAQTKPTPAAPPPPVSTESGASASPAPSQVQSQSRKARPVIGLGRHFEAALSGAGVAVGPGERKKRDKGGEPDSIPAAAAPGFGKGKEGGRRHREERPAQALVVPSILQRPDTGSPEVVIMQRPQSPRVVEPAGQSETAPPRGGGPRRGRGRGRGGNRGG